MPNKEKSYRRQQELSANRLRQILLIVAGLVVVTIVIVTLITYQNTPLDVSFPAREMGPADAKVVVEIFSDFQCPWCGVFARGPEITLREQYAETGKIRYIYRNFPVVDDFVANGTESHLAAQAALCAGDQGEFWIYHDALYLNQSQTENSGNLSRPRLYALAVQLQLDGIVFEKCMGDQTHKNVVDADAALAQSLGIDATPNFLVNGQQVEIKTTDFQQLFDAIDASLLALGGS